MAILFHPMSHTATAKLYVYEPGTTTDKTVYSDSAMSVAHAQPVESSSTGVFAAIYTTGSMRLVYKDSSDVLIPNADYDDVTIALTDAQFATWDSTITYAANDIRYRTADYYISLQGSNLNNDPVSAATYWSKLKLFEVFNTNKTYASGDVCIGSDNATYASQVGSNVGNDPTTDTGANWRKTSEDRWQEVAASYTAKPFEMVIPDNSAGVATLTLPASPIEGDWVRWRQKYGAPVATYAITIGRNGSPMMGGTDDVSVDVEYFNGMALYVDDVTGWRIDYMGSSGA